MEMLGITHGERLVLHVVMEWVVRVNSSFYE